MIINLLANNGYIVLNKTLMKKVGLYEAPLKNLVVKKINDKSSIF